MNVDFVKNDYRFNARASAIILNEYPNKRIAIVSHGTAISYLLKKWCDANIVDDKFRYTFKNEIIFDSCFNYFETFKLVFYDENKLIDIKNIKLD